MLFKQVKQSLFNKFKEYETQAHELSYLFWECTQRCNLNCLHCGSDCMKNAVNKDMPLQDFLNVLDQINAKPHLPVTIAITGGEPLLRKDLEECGRQICLRGFHWGIVTNGYAYTAGRHSSLMDSGMGSVTVSLDGLEDSHNWLRNNKDSFVRAVDALTMIAGEPVLNSDVVTCVNKRNINELEQVWRLLRDRKVKAWRLFTITPIGRARDKAGLQLDGREMLCLMDFISRKRKDKGMAVNFSCEGYVGAYEGKVRDNFFFCRAGINIGSVLINGDISACPNVDRCFVQGNIYEDAFTAVWDTRFGVFRDRSWTRKGLCVECPKYATCRGNGMHYWNDTRNGPMQCHYNLIEQAKRRDL